MYFSTCGYITILLLTAQVLRAVDEVNIIFLTDTDTDGTHWPIVVNWTQLIIHNAKLIGNNYTVK